MASVDGKINILVDGLRKVKELNKELNRTSRSIGQINRRTVKAAVEKAQKQDRRRGDNFFTKQHIPSLNNLNRTLGKAASNFNKVDISSDKARVAAEQLAKSEMALNEVLKEKNRLLSEAQTKLKLQNLDPNELRGQSSGLNFGRRGELLRGPAGSNRLSLRNLGRRFDKSSALIGGGFPLLFGGGPLQALAGGLGGGIGGMFGKMGGFAGSIAATAAVQSIQQTVTAIADLGKTMGPFVQDTNALVNAMGLAGTAEGARIKIIEQLEGKQAAFNAAMQKMNETVGTEATKRLKDFGEKASLVGSEFRIAMTRMQASLIPVINLVDRLFGISANAQRLQRERTIKNSKDVNIRSRVDEIEQLRSQTGGGRQAVKRRNDRINLLKKELKLRADVEIIETNIQTKADELTLEFAQHVKKIKEKADLEKEVAKLMAGGMKQSVAEQIAQNNILADQARKRLEIELEIIKARINDPTLTKDQLSAAVVEFNRIKQILLDIGVEQDKINKLTEEYGKKAGKVKVTKEQITNLLANEMTNAIMGLIEGTRTLGESLASIAKSLANMFLNAAFQNMFNNLFPGPKKTQGKQGLYNRTGGFKAFQYGGVVNSPTMGIIGEGGESEYVIPASKMDGAMARYSAGARGGAVIPGGSHESGTVAGGSGNTIVEYTGPTLNFNGDEYVPKSAVPEIIGAAAKRGAVAGRAQVIGSLKNSRSQRSSLGL